MPTCEFQANSGYLHLLNTLISYWNITFEVIVVVLISLLTRCWGTKMIWDAKIFDRDMATMCHLVSWMCTSWTHNFQMRSTALLLSQITLQVLKNTHHVYKAFQSFCFRISSRVMLPFPSPFRPRSNQSWRVCVWHKTTRGLWQRGNCPFGQQVSQTHISHTERFIWWWLVHSALSELLSEHLNETNITLNVMSCSFKHIRVKWIVVVFLITLRHSFIL